MHSGIYTHCRHHTAAIVIKGVSMAGIYDRLESEIEKNYIGSRNTIRALTVALVTGGHVLLEGVPGIAKTTLAKTLAQASGTEFNRIQFTMDLMPSDITGSSIYRMNTGEFEFIRGPVFTHILLADEINRASARTQSALLEAMQEHQVTVDGKTYPLPDPFFVIATRNPEEERGTYPLPDSQLDRFMFRLRLGYPSAAQEVEIILQAARPPAAIQPVLTRDDFVEIRKQIREIRVSENIVQYIADLIRATRQDARVEQGASPRAGAMLLEAARGYAWLREGSFVQPDDVREAFPLLVNHRITLVDDDFPVDDVVMSVMDRVRFR